MAGEDVLDHVVISTDDPLEVTSGYDGYVHSDRMNTETQTQRFRTATQKLRVVKIRNSGTTYNALIGKYSSAELYFAQHAYTLIPGYTLWLEFVDLYQLGYLYSTNFTSLEVIGTY